MNDDNTRTHMILSRDINGLETKITDGGFRRVVWNTHSDSCFLLLLLLWTAFPWSLFLKRTRFFSSHAWILRVNLLLGLFVPGTTISNGDLFRVFQQEADVAAAKHVEWLQILMEELGCKQKRACTCMQRQHLGNQDDHQLFRFNVEGLSIGYIHCSPGLG